MKLTSAFFALGLVQAVLAESLGPSPTESVGCEPHGDHWYVFLSEHAKVPRSTCARRF